MAQISIDLANAILSGDGVTRHELEQFCIFFINATYQIKQLEQELTEAKAALASQAQQPTEEPVAWMNPYGGLLHVRETGLEKATFTIPLYLKSQLQQSK